MHAFGTTARGRLRNRAMSTERRLGCLQGRTTWRVARPWCLTDSCISVATLAPVDGDTEVSMAFNEAAPRVMGLLLSASAGASAPRTMNARVVAISETPKVTSGVIISWVYMTVTEDGVAMTKLQLAYVSAATKLPRVGEHCVFAVHGERSGSTRDRSGVAVDDSIVVDDFQCGWAATS